MTDAQSQAGVYVPPGPSQADGYERESIHVEMADGCRVAVDVLHPAKGGVRLDGERPTVLHATPYRRSFVITGRGQSVARYAQAFGELGLGPGDLVTQYEARPLARDLINQGYNFVSMDIRGTGASFGPEYQDNWRTGHDIAQVVQWITAQPWAGDKVGMIGISYEGMVQLATACFAPAGLACIAPQYPGHHSCIMDGGLAMTSFARTWETLHRAMSAHEPALPVDGADGEGLREAAEAERSPDRYAWVEHFTQADPATVTELATWDPYATARERSDVGLGEVPAGFFGAHDLLNDSGIPVYLSSGWWDLTFPGHITDLYNRLTVPKKLLLGPWNHGQGGDPELLRWLDHWLRGVANGVMDEPPVLYAATEPSGEVTWKAATAFPLAEAQHRRFHLTEGGGLAAAPGAEASRVSYQVDPGVTLGPLTRHSFYVDDLYINTVDLAARAERCLAFTTVPLDGDIEVTGWPAVELELSTSSDCGAVVVTLEHVQADGAVAQLSEGFLNLAHRQVTDNPLGHGGPVWHSYLKDDLLPVVPGEAMAIRLELYPVSAILRAGDRLRLTIAGADADNLGAPAAGDGASLDITLGGERGGRLLLPMVNPNLAATTRVVAGAFRGENAKFAFRRPEDPPLAAGKGN
ncbi:MAG: CocE/NonD family hydrolase [Alphaproteobacteria bacterium]|nr:CocE/NonD family hydrolase [Alphaproteobacteria bacterium]